MAGTKGQCMIPLTSRECLENLVYSFSKNLRSNLFFFFPGRKFFRTRVFHLSLSEREKKKRKFFEPAKEKNKNEIIIVLIFFQNFLEILEINRGMEKNIGIIKRGKYRSSKIICQQIEIFAVGLKQIPFN